MLKLPGFTLLSGVGWCLDFVIFNVLIGLGLTYFGSNLISATCAVTFVLITARRWIFRNHVASLHSVVVKYVLWNIFAVTAASYLVATVASGLDTLDLGPLFTSLAYFADAAPDRVFVVSNIAKLLVTPLTMYANFVMVGYIVERRVSFY